MANEFIARNGLIALNNSTFTGSLNITGSFTISGSILPSVNSTYNIGAPSFRFSTIYLSSLLYTQGIRSTQLTFGDESGNNFGRFYSTTGNFGLQNNGTFTDNGYRLQINSTGSDSGSLYISGSSSQPLLKIDSSVSSSIIYVSGSGNIGIGTSTPFTTLEIATPFYSAIQFNGASVRIGQHSGIGYNRIYADTSTSTWIFDYSGILQFRNQSIPKTVLDASGSIGIGILTPSASLHISGASTTNLLRIDSPSSSSILFVSGSSRVGIGTNNPVAAFDVINNTSSAGSVQIAAFRTSASAGYISLYNYTSPFEIVRVESWNDIASGGSLRLYTLNSGTMTEKFRITNDGQTYIGTGGVIPTSRLQVRGIGATSATTTFQLQNSTPSTLLTVLDNGQHTYSGPLMILGASQSAYVISQSISSSNIVGGQVYGVNITPTFWQTTSSQTETAFRVAATFTQSSVVASSGSNIIADFGATSVGSQLTITDVISGSIYMVNDVSGLPIIEATSDWTVNMYNFPTKVFQKTGSSVIISGSLIVAPTGSFVFPLTSSASPLTGSAYWSGSLLFVWDGSRYRSSSFA